MKLCACGCGQPITAKDHRTKFIKGHFIIKKPMLTKICQCGCGKTFTTKNPNVRFIRGHKDKELIDKIQNSIKKKCLEKYGVDNVFKLQSFQDMCKKRMIEKYGVDNPLKCKEIQEKTKQTCFEKYGVYNPQKSKIVQEKTRQTCLEKYGVENVSLVKNIQDKRNKTFIEKYNCKCATQCDKFKKKMIDSQISKYGSCFLSTNTLRNHNTNLRRSIIYEKISNNNYYDFLTDKDTFLKNGFYKKSHFINTDNCIIKDGGWLYYKVRCKKCGQIQYKNFYGLNGIFKCIKCRPFITRSCSENEIEIFIQSLNIQTEHSNRLILNNGKELDIYIPSKNVAIEYNGLYWHSVEYHPDPKYHLNKTIQCQEKGIHLIHIFEDEWIYHQDIVKSRLKNLLGIYDKIIYARKCTIKEISDPTEYALFLEDNHLQGFIASRYNIGLYYNDELVSLMTFGPYRKSMNQENKENCYEMYRFCNKLGYHIPGAASKLFKYFIKTYNPIEITSYADRRWSNGNLYYKLGFILDHVSQPNYWYTKDYLNREYRFKYRKSELPKLLESFDPNQTEQQNMLNNGYDIIYDCGNFVFKWKKL